MPREQHSDDTTIEQPRTLVDLGDLVAALKQGREPEIVEADPALMTKEYQDELEFMAQWMTIRIEASGAENEAQTFPVWVNGRGAEVVMADGKPQIVTHLPVGLEIIVRRSVVEIIARSKTMKVRTEHESGGPDQQVLATQRMPNRRTSQTQPFSILHDPSPRGRAWASEMIRRAF